eukprot:800882-Lingulodinium_polyedra.AAC.1
MGDTALSSDTRSLPARPLCGRGVPDGHHGDAYSHAFTASRLGNHQVPQRRGRVAVRWSASAPLTLLVGPRSSRGTTLALF